MGAGRLPSFPPRYDSGLAEGVVRAMLGAGLGRKGGPEGWGRVVGWRRARAPLCECKALCGATGSVVTAPSSQASSTLTAQGRLCPSDFIRSLPGLRSKFPPKTVLQNSLLYFSQHGLCLLATLST